MNKRRGKRRDHIMGIHGASGNRHSLAGKYIYRNDIAPALGALSKIFFNQCQNGILS